MLPALYRSDSGDQDQNSLEEEQLHGGGRTSLGKSTGADEINDCKLDHSIEHNLIYLWHFQDFPIRLRLRNIRNQNVLDLHLDL